MVEALEGCTCNLEAHHETAEGGRAFEQDDLVAALGESEGGRASGDAAADDGDARSPGTGDAMGGVARTGVP